MEHHQSSRGKDQINRFAVKATSLLEEARHERAFLCPSKPPSAVFFRLLDAVVKNFQRNINHCLLFIKHYFMLIMSALQNKAAPTFTSLAARLKQPGEKTGGSVGGRSEKRGQSVSSRGAEIAEFRLVLGAKRSRLFECPFRSLQAKDDRTDAIRQLRPVGDSRGTGSTRKRAAHSLNPGTMRGSRRAEVSLLACWQSHDWI